MSRILIAWEQGGNYGHLARGRVRLDRLPANYAEILLGDGYAEATGLLGMVQAWCGLLAMHRSDMVLAVHAPTALLAACVIGTPHLAIGNGFAVPPDTVPVPSIRPWEPVAEARLLHAGNTVDAAVRDVAVKLGHFGIREEARYIGPIFSLAGAKRVASIRRPIRRLHASAGCPARRCRHRNLCQQQAGPAPHRVERIMNSGTP